MTLNTESLLPYYTAQSGSGVGMFNTAMGKLQRQLYKGEYDIFKYAPIFESDFIQITKRGEVIDVHNRVRMVTVGIACTSPVLPLPDVMLLARPAPGGEDFPGHGQTKGKKRKAAKTLELTRLLPLKFVRISVHNHEKQQLRLLFATGRSCYLQLCPPLDGRDDLFTYWEKLIYLLRPPVDSNSSTYATPAEDIVCMPLLDEEDKSNPTVADSQGKGEPDQVSIRSLPMVTDITGVSSAAFAGGERIHHDSPQPIAVPIVSMPKTKSKDLTKESATGTTTAVAVGDLAGALSLAATRSVSSGQINAAIAGGASMAARGSKSHLTITSVGKMSPKSMKVALAGAASKSLECISNTSPSLSQKESLTMAIARIESTSKSGGETATDPVTLALTLPSERLSTGQTGQQIAPEANMQVNKEQRVRREQRSKVRAGSRSSHHPRTDGRHKTTGDKVVQKSPSHRSALDEKEKGTPRGSKHNRSHKGVSHVPITKESWSSHKSGRTLSTTSSVTTSKRPGRIGLFLRNIRANLAAKGLASQRGQDMDIIAKTLEATNMEAIMETESGQGLDIIGSVTSEVMETVTFKAS